MESYFAAKALLFDGRCEHEVVTVDDPYGRRLVKPGTVTVSAAGDPAADWRAVEVGPAAGGLDRLPGARAGGVDLPALVRMPGTFNVANGLLAIATLVTVGRARADRGRRRGRPRRAGPDGEGRLRPGVRRGGRLRAQPGRGAAAARRAPPGRDRPDHPGARRRRRPGPGQAAADGRGRRGRRGRRCWSPTTTRARRTRRRSGPRCWPARSACRTGGEVVEVDGPARRRSSRRCAGPGPGTRSSSPARGTSRGRRSAAWCTRSTTGRCCGPRWRS